MSAQKSTLSVLTLAAIGVVFGDIGTSPLYALKECFHMTHGLLALTEANVMGLLSLIFWSIMLMVSLKYVVFIMSAHNNGEGGIMALLSLSLRNKNISIRQKNFLITIGLFGAALFFGDGMITPAISVLSAVEGLTVVSPQFSNLVLPLAIGIITGLFMIQRNGTATMGKYFGPLTLLWFISIGGLGLQAVIDNPAILYFLNPVWALEFSFSHPIMSFALLGAIVLTITGGEALYADMGHFGRKPIMIGWVLVVLPCLMLNYAGQGALILQNPAAVANPFYFLVPPALIYPMIVLATIATVIASQAVISGVFSIARQAIQLGYLPRLSILHTSESEKGQIYIPFLNWVLFASVILLVLLFRSSGNLAAAYGIAVTLTMLCDTILVSFVMYSLWRWSLTKVLLFFIPFFILDCLFFSATSLKILQGGWVPMLIGITAFTIMRTWKDGRGILFAKLRSDTLPIDLFVKSVGNSAHMISGTAIFMNSTPDTTPHALLHNLKHNKVLHSHNIITTVIVKDIPYVNDNERASIIELSPHFWVVTLRYGFKQQPNIPLALTAILTEKGIPFDEMSASYFVSRERIIHTRGDGLAPWREKLFISMSRNTSAASDFFQIPSGRVIELGAQIEI